MSKRKVLPFRIFFAASAITIATLVYTLFSYNIGDKKNIENYTNQIRTTTNSLSTNAELIFLSLDQTLQLATEKTDSADIQDRITSLASKNPYIASIFITNEHGAVQIFSQKHKEDFVLQPGSLLDEKHFNYYKEHNAKEFNISITPGDTLQNSNILISRRIETPTGEFGGLAVAIIDSKNLSSLLNAPNGMQDKDIYLLLNHNQILSQNTNNPRPSLLKSVMDEVKLSDIKTDEPLIFEKTINDTAKIFSFQEAGSFPITVAIIVNKPSSYTKYSELLESDALVAMSFILAIIFFGILAKQLSQAEKYKKRAMIANQAKSDFLGKMGHELRTPLNAIIGFSDMLSSGYFGKVTKAQIERLKDINMCGHHLLGLICNILEFSQSEAGKITLNEEEVDVYNAATQSILTVEQQAKKKNVKIINNISREAPAIIADAYKLTQIIGHLLSNSVKFTKPGGKVIISSHFDKERNFAITVSDTGIGISNANLEKVMQVFEQVNSNTHEGAGLGLPLCKIMVELHDGTIALESKINVGTKVLITLPAARVVTAVEAPKELASIFI